MQGAILVAKEQYKLSKQTMQKGIGSGENAHHNIWLQALLYSQESARGLSLNCNLSLGCNQDLSSKQRH